MASFSEEVMAVIFSGLPVKSLLRFKCLSKFMCSIIVKPEFTKLHLDRSVLNESDLCLALDDLKSGGTMHFMDLDMSDNFLVQLDRTLTFEAQRMNRFLLGTCNGLVALYRFQGIALRNPSTNTQLLAENFWDNVITDPNESGDQILDGFGYDVVNDDYKLVKIIQCSDDQTAKTVVYSAKARNSKRLPNCPFVYTANAQQIPGTYVAGSLHWIVYKGIVDSNDNFEDDEDSEEEEADKEEEAHIEEMIIALDLTTEIFHVVPGPEIECRSSALGALKDCLAIGFCNSTTSNFEIWSMKEYRVEASWTKLVHVTRAEYEVFGIRNTMRPLYLSRKGDRILLEMNGSYLFWYNIVLHRIEYFQSFANIPSHFYSQLMSRNLVSLPGVDN